MDDEKTPKSIKLWMVLTILVTMCLMSTVVFQHLMHIRLVEEVTELKSELRVLTMKTRNPFPMNWVITKLEHLKVKGQLQPIIIRSVVQQ